MHIICNIRPALHQASSLFFAVLSCCSSNMAYFAVLNLQAALLLGRGTGACLSQQWPGQASQEGSSSSHGE